ncbi:MAG: FAD-binding oxidoreductase [Deltaproteobacteria bacterium]|nr:FAD-binding oxidoreductase [Deltaproteobacteria bacterium]
MDQVKEQLCAIVGREYLVSDAEDLAPYSRDNISFIPDRRPLLAVRPGTIEEVQAVLQVARLHKLPVTPLSSGKNGHGAAIPAVPGLTIDLRRLNTIHLIDVACRNAVIEPGVTFAQLHSAAKQKGLRVLTPLELPADCSVIATYLEMTPLYAWPRYGTESVLTMEVLLPNGELIKTGLAALPVFDTPYFPFGTTPSYFNKAWFGAQGTLGIVTKATIKLKTDHTAKQVLFIPYDSFEQSISVLREIKRLDSPVESFVANNTWLSGMLAQDNAAFTSLRDGLPPVTVVLVLRGEQEQVAYQRADLRDLADKMGCELLESLPADRNASEKILDEIELPAGYERFQRFRGGYAVIPFICMARQIPLFNRAVAAIAQQLDYNPLDIGSLLLPVEPSRVHFQYSFYTDPGNPQEYLKVKNLFQTLSSTLIKMGAFFSRPYGAWARQVYAKAGAYKAMLKLIKGKVDPEHIMNPGKLNL